MVIMIWVHGIPSEKEILKEGDIIAKIDTTDYEIALDKADAAYEKMLLGQQNAKANLAASQVAQNAFIAQGFSNEVDQLYNRLNSCPVPSTPVYGRTPIFTCNQNGGCGCGGNAFYN